MSNLRILTMSDVHGKCDDKHVFETRIMDLPKADICVVAGDLTNYGIFNREDLGNAKAMMRSLTIRYSCLLWVPGNHDFGVDEDTFKGLLGVERLTASPFKMLTQRLKAPEVETRFCGVSLSVAYEMPSLAYTWCHMTTDRDVERRAFLLPECDILVSHSPPYGFCDGDGYDIVRKETCHIGSKQLLGYIHRSQPKLVICGHSHGGSGEAMIGATRVVNVACRWELLEVEIPTYPAEVQLPPLTCHPDGTFDRLEK